MPTPLYVFVQYSSDFELVAVVLAEAGAEVEVVAEAEVEPAWLPLEVGWLTLPSNVDGDFAAASEPTDSSKESADNVEEVELRAEAVREGAEDPAMAAVGVEGGCGGIEDGGEVLLSWLPKSLVMGTPSDRA